MGGFFYVMSGLMSLILSAKTTRAFSSVLILL